MENSPPAGSKGSGKKKSWILKKVETFKQKKQKLREQKLKLWGDIGYHRYIGGENYNMVLNLIFVPLSLLLFAAVTEIFFPDPSVQGYQDLTKSLLGFFFGVMDIGLGGGQGYMSGNMERFISEHAQMNPRKALKQIQFFVSWQMFTGLVQVTAVGIYCFTVMINTSLVHMILFIIAYSFIQYPGILQLFESLFQAFQRFDFHGVITNVRDALFAPFAQICCVLLGKWWGMNNPVVGETMGITIGFLVSIYVADIFGAFFGGVLFKKKVIDEFHYNFKVRDFFRIDYKWKDVKEILYFIGPIQFIGTALGFLGLITTIWITQWVDSYASWKGLLAFAGTIAGLAMPGGSNKSYSTVSEAYNNGKINLTHDYIEKILKYHSMRSTTNILPVMILLPLLLEKAVELLGLGNLDEYMAGLIVIPILVIISASGNIFGVGERMLVIATKRNVIITFQLVSPFVNFFFSWLFLVYFELGWLAIPLFGFVPSAILSTIRLVYVFKKILPGFKFTGWWQTIIAPLVSMFGMGLIGLALSWSIGPALSFANTHFEGTVAADVALYGFIGLLAYLLFIGFPIIYQIFYGLMGGWDDDSLEEYRKGVVLSGPSAWMVKPIYRVAKFMSKISPLHNRFPIKFQDAVTREIKELELLREQNK
ncbi:MAG: hypothetical protein ACTSUE_13835 [Promethearchaeota archaeon]